MKKLSTYLISLIISVMLVFMIIATAISVIVKINVTEKKCNQLSENINMSITIKEELQKYFSNQYNTTGIPSKTYMDAIDEEYINNIMNLYTNALFNSLSSGNPAIIEIPENESLENNIETFFSDYADSNNFQKDDVYYEKISSTISNAYNVIESYCDIYKYSSLQDYGVISKISVLYNNMGKIMTICIIVSVFLIVVMALFNIREISSVLYWTGVSALVAGLLGTLPSAYLIGADYFDSFAIKQQQVFKAFTSAMYGITQAFMAVHIAVLVIGIFFIVIYTVLKRLYKSSEQ